MCIRPRGAGPKRGKAFEARCRCPASSANCDRPGGVREGRELAVEEAAAWCSSTASGSRNANVYSPTLRQIRHPSRPTEFAPLAPTARIMYGSIRIGSDLAGVLVASVTRASATRRCGLSELPAAVDQVLDVREAIEGPTLWPEIPASDISRVRRPRATSPQERAVVELS